VIGVQLIVILILIILLSKCSQTINDQSELLDTKSQIIKITTNKLGEQTATTQVYEAQLKNLKGSHKKQLDSTYWRIIQIECYYKRRLVAATTVDIVTNDTASTATTITSDTVKRGDSTIVRPVYKGLIVKKFSRYDIIASADSIHITSWFNNPIDVIHRYEQGKNFLGRKNLMIDVHTYNPDSGVSSLRSFTIKEKKRHLGAKMLIAFLAGGATVYYLQR
jgi:hypothetical protein